MDTFVHLLMPILVFLSYVCFSSLVSIESRMLNSNKVISIDFIHRDSMLSPHYNSSMTTEQRKRRRILGSISRSHHHIKRSLATTDSGVAVTPSDGEYLMKIAIGTPPVQFLAIADTGSDLTWLQCSPCRICVPQPTPPFDPTKSSTYQSIACNSQSCIYPDIFTGCHVNDTTMNGPCLYFQGYADSSNTTGFLSTETITFPSADTVSSTVATFPSFVFGCGYLQFGSLFNGQGIIGLGPGPVSLVSQLGQDIGHKFSYCLVPETSETTSKMRFGADVMGPNVVSTPFLVKDPPGYYLTLDGITIGDDLIQVGQDVIIDSGTTLTWLETNIYNSLRDALKDAIALSPVPDPEGLLELCYETEQALKLNPPEVVFHFKGADVVLQPLNIFWELGNVTCLAMMPSEPDNHSYFGNIAQVNFEVGYDLQAKQVSFAPTNCTIF